MPAHDVIGVYFYHVLAIQVASVAHAFQLVANGLDCAAAGAFF